jgi:hypothetical protein
MTFGNHIRVIAALALLSSLVSTGVRAFAQQPLGFNNVAVWRSGDGISSLSTTTAVQSLLEFTPGGSLVQTITMPSTGTATKLTNVGNTSSVGTLSISPDGRWIAFGGYDIGTGSSSPAGTTTTPRVAGILNTTTGTYSLTPMGSAFRVSSGAAIRGVATNDGNNIWAIGSSQGLVYGSVTGGTGSFGTISSGIATNFNQISVVGGASTSLVATTNQSTNPRVGSFGPASLPSGTATSFTVLPGLPSAGTIGAGFVVLDTNPSIAGLDTLYLTDASATVTGGIYKYSLGLSGTWVASGQLTGTSTVQLRGLSGFVSGTSVRLFATSASNLYTYWDADAAAGSLTGSIVPSLTSIATAPVNTEFRGVAVVPEPSTAVLIAIGAALGVAELVRRRRRRVSES